MYNDDSHGISKEKYVVMFVIRETVGGSQPVCL